VLGYDAISLGQVAVFCTTPNVVVGADPTPGGAGIWQAGVGLATDSTGAIYCTTGNGYFDPTSRNYGDTVLKLGRDLRLLDSFTPANQPDLMAEDLDLGSGGALVVPDEAGAATALLMACGKDGNLYILNRQAMGGYTGPGGDNPQALQALQLNPAGLRHREASNRIDDPTKPTAAPDRAIHSLVDSYQA
jgi:hypothetical protein